MTPHVTLASLFTGTKGHRQLEPGPTFGDLTDTGPPKPNGGTIAA